MNSGSLMTCAVTPRSAGDVLAAMVATAARGFERPAVRTITRHKIPAAIAPNVKLGGLSTGAVHEKFKTPHISTMLTGGIISLVAAFTPITCSRWYNKEIEF
jgi:amino acid transporter